MRTIKEDEIEAITRSLSELRIAREAANGRFNRQERALHIQLATATGVVIPGEPTIVPPDNSAQVARGIQSQGPIDLPNVVKSEPNTAHTPTEPVKEVFQDITSSKDLKPGDSVRITNRLGHIQGEPIEADRRATVLKVNPVRITIETLSGVKTSRIKRNLQKVVQSIVV